MNINRNTTKLLQKTLNQCSILNATRFASKTTAEYCIDSVKKYDYENFVCTLLLKNSIRCSAFAIRSFNVEIAQVAEQVSQETIGQMRLKFWEDTVEKCLSNDYKAVPKHPVAQELFKANSRQKLTKRYLRNLILSRKNSLGLTNFNTIEDIENYSDHTVSSIYYLVLESSNVRNVHADHAASHLGKAQGIVQQIRSVPHARRLNFLPIPLDILVKNKVVQEDVLRGKKSEQLTDCIFEFASRAYQHLKKARSLAETVPQEAKSVFLPAVPIYMYLDKLQKVNYDVFHPTLQRRSWQMLPKVWLANFRNVY
ncbi:unnamed protein product [Phyllotreta striolata]|uniref:NADH dehydrogenase (Ubiquinone) complex I, assembly factor 6 n=1 Tax=Phyllotreta striolata TaxID=444603 RepID=A0A9N9TQ71_PHYSR|nr:unnamed protein product [Phyllotreta striolata]